MTILLRLKQSGATLVTCRAATSMSASGDPPVEPVLRSGVAVAVGTDSLASNDDLNMFSELAALRRLAPAVRPRRCLRARRRRRPGARLRRRGRHDRAGPRTGLIAVELPPDVVDVEEYLVSGVPADRVHWVDTLLGPHLRYA